MTQDAFLELVSGILSLDLRREEDIVSIPGAGTSRRESQGPDPEA